MIHGSHAEDRVTAQQLNPTQLSESDVALLHRYMVSPWFGFLPVSQFRVVVVQHIDDDLQRAVESTGIPAN